MLCQECVPGVLATRRARRNGRIPVTLCELGRCLLGTQVALSLHTGSIQMNMTTLLIVVLLLFVFGGGGGYYWNRSRR